MLHLYASETLAALTLVALVLFFSALHYLAVPWWMARSTWDLAVLVASCIYACRLTARGHRCRWPHNVDFHGRIALVTGASSGVGYAVAEELVKHGWSVILAGRDAERLLLARQKLLHHVHSDGVYGVGWFWWTRVLFFGEQEPNPKLRRQPQEVKVIGTVDLADEASVRDYADQLIKIKHKYPIALLVNAAGTLCRHRKYCGEVYGSSNAWADVEVMLATNSLGPLLLTKLLIPILDEAAERSGVSSRIVNVASSCHTYLGSGTSAQNDPIKMIEGLEAAAHISPTATELPKSMDPAYVISDFSLLNFVGYYGLSKLCVLWNTQILCREVASLTFSTPGATTNTPGDRRAPSQQKIFVASCHPGVITTRLYRDLLPVWFLDYVVYYPSLLLGKTWNESAQSTLKAAVEAENMVQGGYYMCGGEYGESSGVCCLSRWAKDAKARQAYAEWATKKLNKL